MLETFDGVPAEILERLRALADNPDVTLADLEAEGLLPCPLPRRALNDDERRADFKWADEPCFQPYKPYLRLETSFIRETTATFPWNRKEAIEIGLDQKECPVCGGTRRIWVDKRGSLTGVQVILPETCRCIFLLGFCPKWFDPAVVPSSYQGLELGKLDNYRAAFHTFDAVGSYEALRDHACSNRHDSALLTGPAGTGKTTLLLALYHQALFEWAILPERANHSVWFVTAPQLLKEIKTYELRDRTETATGPVTPQPTVTANKATYAAKNGLVPRLFIDELDKIKLDSDFQARELIAILNAVYAAGGQIVATTNLSPQEFAEALGPQYGPTLIRRMTGPHWNAANPEDPTSSDSSGAWIDFESGRIHRNWLPGGTTCVGEEEMELGYSNSLAQFRIEA